MKKKDIQFTIAQFAKLHDVNKRTLHYYDNIGLFSPQKKRIMVIDIIHLHKV